MKNNDTNEEKEQPLVDIDRFHDKCPTTVHETVCIKAKVTITPDVKVHDIKYYCSDGPVIWDCQEAENCSNSCTFEVGQKICVEIPITFSAKAKVDPNGIVCGTPESGKCHHKSPCKERAPVLDSLLNNEITLNLISSYFPTIKNLIKELVASNKSKKG